MGIDASLTDILPRVGAFGAVSGAVSLQNRMFVLSLQKREASSVRAWLFHRSSMCRFYPSDMLHLWPSLFAKSKQNKLTKEETESLRDLIARHPLSDAKFDAFAREKHNEVKEPDKKKKCCDVRCQ